MKFILGFTLIALGQGAILTSKSVGVSFGPQNCVSLTRSSAGSCVLSTSCEGVDTSTTEFAFDCINQNVVRHSFGVGGFESSEEFDTEVKCGRCSSVLRQHQPEAAAPVKKVQAILEPTPTHAAPMPAAQVVEAKVVAPPQAPPAPLPANQQQAHEEVVPGAIVLNRKATTKVKGQAQAFPLSGGSSRKESPPVVKYGPDGCVSTWRNGEGHCIMKTDCADANVAGVPAVKSYEFGLVCVDKNGSPVKHLFGKDSFDPKETFDTLIKCDQCLGLEDIPDTVALAGEVASMAKDVNNLKDVMKNISANVMMLNNKIFPQVAGPAPGPASAAPAPAAPAKPAKFLVHGAVSHHRHHHRGNLRHSHHKRHHRHHRQEDDDDDDDDQDDYRGEERDDGEKHNDNNAEEPKTEAVDAINEAAVQMQQARAAKAVQEQKVRYVPMNTPSNLGQTSGASVSDDDDADDGSDED